MENIDIVDRIVAKGYDKATKIIRLFCIVQLNYRQALGDKAWDAIEKLTDRDTVTAIAFITGLSMGAGMAENKDLTDRFIELVPEINEGK